MKEFLLLTCLGSDVVNKDTARGPEADMQTPVTASSLLSKYTQPLTFYNLKRGGEAGIELFNVHPSALKYFLQVFFCVFLIRFYGPKHKDSSGCYEVNYWQIYKILRVQFTSAEALKRPYLPINCL
jgi:hypothetical protein